MNSASLIFALVVAVALGFSGYRIGIGRGRPVLGAVLGFALGLIGLGIFMLIPRTPEAKAARARARQLPRDPQDWPQPGEPAGLRTPGTGPDAQ